MPVPTPTALDLIKRSLRLLGVYSIAEEPSAEEAQDALAALNALMDSLANSSLLVHARSNDAVAFAAGVASKTIGPTGAVVTDRPVEVLSESYIAYGGTDYPLDLFTLDQYNSVADKTATGLPLGLYVQASYPNITATLWPVPDQAATLQLWSNKQITAFPALTTTVSLPPGYARMLAFMLAEDIAPEYQREPTPTIMRMAASARRALKRTNTEVPMLDMPRGVPVYWGGDIWSGL